MVQVKICGIRREEDALLAAKYGADAIGLLVGRRYNSPDFITAELAGRIARSLPAAVSAVLVTHVTELDEIERLLRTSGLRRVQLHGEISPGSITELRRRLPDLVIFKSVHVVSTDSLEYPQKFREAVDGFVLDSINLATEQIGGTGMVHDWSISREIVARYHDMPIFLAGGLTPANVAMAIKTVRPLGVDVNSGTKGTDGYKDTQRLRDFIDQAKRADLEA